MKVDGIDSSFQVIGFTFTRATFSAVKSLTDVFKIIVIYQCAQNLKIVRL